LCLSRVRRKDYEKAVSANFAGRFAFIGTESVMECRHFFNGFSAKKDSYDQEKSHNNEEKSNYQKENYNPKETRQQIYQ
jgi:hypothetical protein